MATSFNGRWYAVRVGRQSMVVVGSWEECEPLVKNFSGAQCKKFSNYANAVAWLYGATAGGLGEGGPGVAHHVTQAVVLPPTTQAVVPPTTPRWLGFSLCVLTGSVVVLAFLVGQCIQRQNSLLDFLSPSRLIQLGDTRGALDRVKKPTWFTAFPD